MQNQTGQDNDNIDVLVTVRRNGVQVHQQFTPLTTQQSEQEIQEPFSETSEESYQPEVTISLKKGPVRATHFKDEQDIDWVRTGVTIPTAYWKAIEAFVHEKKQEWQPGEERVTQNQLVVDALGTWINDHRNQLSPQVTARFDETFGKIPHI